MENKRFKTMDAGSVPHTAEHIVDPTPINAYARDYVSGIWLK